jgi:broad specificity phosphatase PhoE
MKNDKIYYIFRHGETHATKTNRWYWHRLYSATILEEGKPSVIKLANYLKDVKTDFNVSSPFLRCRQTTEIVEEITAKKFVFDKRIGELTFQPPWIFRRRILEFINEMEKSNLQNILVCTHSAVITVLLNHLTISDPSRKEKLVAPRPGYLSIIKNGELKEINFNEKI